MTAMDEFDRESDARLLWDAQHRAEFLLKMWYELLRRSHPYNQEIRPMTIADVERLCTDVLLRLYDLPRYGGPAAPRIPPPNDPADMLATIESLQAELDRHKEASG